MAPQQWPYRDLSSPPLGPYTPACRHFLSSGSLYCTLAFVFVISPSQLRTKNLKKMRQSITTDKHTKHTQDAGPCFFLFWECLHLINMWIVANV